MCAVGSNSTPSIGGDSAVGTLLGSSVGAGGGGGASVLTKRSGTVLGGASTIASSGKTTTPSREPGSGAGNSNNRM